jgi:hypothetical protein
MSGPQSKAVSTEVQADKDHTITVMLARSLAENFHRLNDIAGIFVYLGVWLSPNNAIVS